MVNLHIDDKPVRAVDGTSLLWAALDNGIYIPSLCSIREAGPALSSCRLCMVEIEGRRGLFAACSEPVSEGLKVHTNTPRVNRSRHSAFALIMSSHKVDCAHCSKHGACGLQEVASFLKVPLKQKTFRQITDSYPVDASHPHLVFDRNKCILCGKCVWACRHKGKGCIDFAGRGMNTRISLFGGQSFQYLDCENCDFACAASCPTGALVYH